MGLKYRNTVEALGADLTKVDPRWLLECERKGVTPEECVGQIREGKARPQEPPVPRSRRRVADIVATVAGIGIGFGLVFALVYSISGDAARSAEELFAESPEELRDLERVRGKRPTPTGPFQLAPMVEARLRKDDPSFSKARDVNPSIVFQYGDKEWGQDVTYVKPNGTTVRRRFSIRDGKITDVEKDFSD